MKKDCELQAGIKCCALPFVTPLRAINAGDVTCLQHSLFKSRAPNKNTRTAPIKSTCKIICTHFIYIFFYNSIAGSLPVRPFQANLCEVEQSPPLRARPARRATASDCHFWKSWESRESDGYNKCNGYHMAVCNCPQIHKVYLFIFILPDERFSQELTSSLVSKMNKKNKSWSHVLCNND